MEVWAFDEHRVGLQPIIKRVYAPKGQQPVVKVNPRYEWLYVYAFVHPNSGRSVWYLMPELNATAFQAVLDDFASSLDPNQHTIILLDNAAWHHSKQLRMPANVEFVFLPPYSPELQPAERLWALSDETITNRCMDGIESLQAELFLQCERLMADPERVKSHTLFHWWPGNC